MNKLVYTDENDLRIYESMPLQDFKEFFMAYFKYNKGDKVEISDFTNPMTFAMFCQYIPKLDNMEENYKKKAAANRENGKKGGRPRKDNTDNIKESDTSTSETPEQDINNKPQSIKRTNIMTIPTEFDIPNEPVVDEGEIDDTADFYYEWQSECRSLIKTAKLDFLDGDYDAMKECNIKLSELMSICINNGCSEVELVKIRGNVESEINEEIDNEYNRRIA